MQALGYNVFDPLEVTPELIADVGTKKGEKVDYAILKEGKPIIIFECKSCINDLNINHASQLFRYFHVTEARFAVLTNGIIYQFFTDLDQPNKMDEKPFFEFNLLNFKDTEIEELKKFTKASFDIDTILATASDLKYVRAIRNVISELMVNPTDDFVKMIASDFLQGKRFTPALKDQFTALTKKAFQQLISNKINDIFNNAINSDSTNLNQSCSALSNEELDELNNDKVKEEVITTKEELEAFYIIKSILRGAISSKRIFMRDALSYCAILLDDNNRKPICRLRFNKLNRLQICFLNGKEEERILIADIDDIHNYSDKLREVVNKYEQTE